MSDSIITICRKHDLQIKKKFTEGNICKNVYLVQKKKGPF